MSRSQRRRTIKRYVELYHDPSTLFHGVNVTVFPNGENEIWLKTADGLGVKVRVGNGPAGLGIQIDTFGGTPTLTVASPDGTHMEVCQYRQDARSQAFRRWYRGEETAADVDLLGPEYRRDPVNRTNAAVGGLL